MVPPLSYFWPHGWEFGGSGLGSRHSTQGNLRSVPFLIGSQRSLLWRDCEFNEAWEMLRLPAFPPFLLASARVDRRLTSRIVVLRT